MVNRHLGRHSKLPHRTDYCRTAAQMALFQSMGWRKLCQNPVNYVLHKSSYRYRNTQHLQQYRIRHHANRHCNCNLRALRINLHKNTESIEKNAHRRGRRARRLRVLTRTPLSFNTKPGHSAWFFNCKNAILKV